jgi:hypothetical protein
MKVKKIKVPFYKWEVISIIIEEHSEKNEVLKKMKSLKMCQADIDNVVDLLDKEATGGALCHYNSGRLLCVIVTFPQNNIKELVSTLIHEARHAADRIIESVGLEGAEAAAYLSEYITLKMIEDYIIKDEPSTAQS